MEKANKYSKDFDRVIFFLPKGSKDRIEELTGKTCSSIMMDLAKRELERLETENVIFENPEETKELMEDLKNKAFFDFVYNSDIPIPDDVRNNPKFKKMVKIAKWLDIQAGDDLEKKRRESEEWESRVTGIMNNLF